MFGFTKDKSGEQKVLVSAAERVNEDDTRDCKSHEGAPMTYRDILEFARRRKFMLACTGTLVLLLLAIIVGAVCVAVCVTMLKPTTPPAPTPTTPMPTSTTTFPTTTTGTTPRTITTQTTTTTPKTTTTQTTPTPPPTTTTGTTPKTTTTQTTPTPPPTTTTGTTPQTTTTKPTTTTENPTTTTSKPPGPAIPTVQPVPSNASVLPATTLIFQVFSQTRVNYTEIHCAEAHPPTFKYVLTIEGVSGNFTGESSFKHSARTAASRSAAETLLGIKYDHSNPIPAPTHPCNEQGMGSLTLN